MSNTPSGPQLELKESWLREEQHPFAGWDFSYLDGRMIEDPTPWSYLNRATELMAGATTLLDIDTGGGERLLEMRHAWPDSVTATEEYPPNLKLAKERLEPEGATVLSVHITETDPMPFANASFDLVLNRHAAFNPSEVYRVLSPDGTFYTQQVHGLWASDLLAEFGKKPQWPEATADRYLPMLEQAGLTIINSVDWSGRLVFRDVGAVVYYLKAVPWMVEDFAVDRYYAKLLELHDRIENHGQLEFSARKYIIEATKLLGV